MSGLPVHTRILVIIAKLKSYQKKTIARRALVFAVIIGLVAPSFMPPQIAEAAIGWRASSATNSAASVTSISLTMPVGTIEGDVMVATVAISNSNSITAPGGWFRVSPSTGTGTPLICANSTTTTVQTWYKEAGASETGPYSFTWTNASYAAGGIAAYSGVNGSSPIDTATNGACTTGTGTALSASGTGVTTASNGAYVIAVWSQMNNTGTTANTIAGTGMNNRVQSQSTPLTVSCGFLCTANTNAATVNESDETQATAGSVATKSATSIVSGAWAGYLYTLKPAIYNFSSSGYRWFSNVNSSDYLSLVTNGSTGQDAINDTALDTANAVSYSVGYDSNGTDRQWRIEKRSTIDGELVTSFDGDGIVTDDISAANNDEAKSIALDLTNGYMYVAGHIGTGASDEDWHVQKRKLSNGALCDAAAACDAVFDTDGRLTISPTSGSNANDRISAIAIDSSHMYLVGWDSVTGGRIRMEKRSLSGGVLDAGFDPDQGDIAPASGTVDGVYILSPSNQNNRVHHGTALALDSTYLYLVAYDENPGNDNSQWRIEKMNKSSGIHEDAFDGDGVVADNMSGTVDVPYSIALDSTSMYVAGVYSASNNDRGWAIQKRSLTSGALNTSFDGETTGDGSLRFNPTSGTHDELFDIAIDSSNLYVSGYDTNETDKRWRIEKRSISTGSRVTAFDGDGIVASNPSDSLDDETYATAIDTTNSRLYIVGYDQTVGSGNSQWRTEVRSTTDGASGLLPSALGNANVAGTGGIGAKVRLRMLMHNLTASLWSTDTAQSYKLQIAPKSDTCDTAYVGEAANFVDVSSSSGEVRYFDNSGPSDGVATGALALDATHGSGPVDITRPQTYEEANNFSNITTIKVGEDGLWDFTLVDNDAFGAYCFRVLKSDGTAVSTPTSVPEINFCGRPRAENTTRGGSYFCDGSERRFYWSL